jgi:hypothetical protein
MNFKEMFRNMEDQNFDWEKYHAEQRKKQLAIDIQNIQEAKKSKENALEVGKIFNKNHKLHKLISADGETLDMAEYYPLLNNVNVPQPKTQIFEIEPWAFYICARFGIEPNPELQNYIDEAKKYVLTQLQNINIPKPFFFKTGTRSLKHASCEMNMFFKNKQEFVEKIEEIFYNIFQNYDNDGYYSNHFIFREILDIDYSVMRNEYIPLANEYRLFFQGSEIQYMQPYYSFEIYKDHAHRELEHKNTTDKQFQELFQSVMQFNEDDLAIVREIISKISTVYKKGAIDLLKDKQGKWWLVDMQPQRLSSGFELLENYKDFDKNVIKYLTPMITF